VARVTPTHPIDPIRHPDRHVPLETAHNFRDLGGYPTSDGRTTRWGVAYRSDALYSLNQADWARLQARNVRHVIDLRSAH